jgi:hypothetical protein
MRYSVRKLVYAVASSSIAILPVAACSSSSSSVAADSGAHDAPPDHGIMKGHDAGHDTGHTTTPDAGHDATTPMDANKEATTIMTSDASDATSHEAATDAEHHDGETDAHHDAEHHDGESDAHHDAEHDSGHDAGNAPKVLNYFMGRWDQSNVTTNNAASGIGSIAEWAGSGVLTTFTGPNIGITLSETCAINPNTNVMSGCDSITVYLDGTAVTTGTLNSATVTGSVANPTFQLISGTNTLQIAATGTASHVVGVYKNTDAWYGGSYVFGGFTISSQTGSSNPQASYNFAHRIEWIGDDITTGAGDNAAGVAGSPDPQDCNEEELSSNENFSYAALVSRDFNAERQNISESNTGVYVSDPATSNGGPPLIGALYDLLLPNEVTTWTFSSWVPDLVVVNLGAYGDFASVGAPDAGSTFVNGYEGAYETFLATVRTDHPSAYILLVAPFDSSGDESYQTIDAWVTAIYNYRLAHGETTSTIGYYAQPSGVTPTGCQYRPGVSDQATLASGVETYLTTTLHWTP